MPQQSWNAKRERQYEHVKQGQKQESRSESTAEEVAARTVNKQRARSGEAAQASAVSTHDKSAPQRGGKRSGKGPGGRTRDQLYQDAKRQGIKGRSKMNKSQLQNAVGR